MSKARRDGADSGRFIPAKRGALLAFSRSVFRTAVDRQRWWRSPHPLLCGKTPWLASQRAGGAERVRDLLVALKHGGVV